MKGGAKDSLAGAALPRFLGDAAFAEQLRSLLDAQGYHEAGIQAQLGVPDTTRLSPGALPHLLEKTAALTPLDVLIRLFVLRVPVPVAAARAAFMPLAMETWIHHGFVHCAHGQVTTQFRIKPFADRLLVSDPSDGDLHFEHVMGPGRASTELFHATVRTPCDRALDLGTGCGIQGLACAAHSREVIGTDINPRALAIARFNARLNGIRNIEFRAGPLFEPAGPEPFDLILMNMPYAISPRVRFLFRDNGGEGDAFLRGLVEQMPDRLRPGGFCQLTAQWAQLDDEPWRAKLWSWFRRLPLDVWILRQSVQTASGYVENWLAETEPEEAGSHWQEWMDYLRNLRISAVHTGMFFLRRRASGRGWFSITDDVSKVGAGAGEDVLAGFQLRDFLWSLRDETQLLDHRYRLAPRTRINQELDPHTPDWRATRTVLRNRGGLGFACEVDERTAVLLRGLDGAHTLRQAVDRYATACGVDRAPLIEHTIATTRSLLEKGFLRPV